jgi:hypothetical protein
MGWRDYASRPSAATTPLSQAKASLAAFNGQASANLTRTWQKVFVDLQKGGVVE